MEADANIHCSAASFSAYCCGTLGELYQGPFDRNGEADIAIISALTNIGTQARFTIGSACNLEKICKYKTKAALEKFLCDVDRLELRGEWSFTGDLKVGAGMASSTADIVAALYCAAKAAGVKITEYAVRRCLRNIERSDSVFVDRPCLYLSERQLIVEFYIRPKAIFCIYGLEGRAVDTTAVKRELIQFYKAECRRYSQLLLSVRRAFLSSNRLEMIHCSTQSALLSQMILPKRHFGFLYKMKDKLGADGMIVAHTGALLGFLFLKEPDKRMKEYIKGFLNGEGLEAYEGRVF